MKKFIEEITQALNSGLYLLVLQSCVTLPDICGALMSESGKATPTEYKNWYDQYAKKHLNCWMSADDCYLLRSSMLHQAKTIPSPRGKQTARYSRIIFTVPESNGLILHNNIINGALNLDVAIFCKGIIDAVEDWMQEMEITKNCNYIKNLSNL